MPYKPKKRKRKNGEKPKAKPVKIVDPKIKDFNDELRKVYHDIDKQSSLLWSHDNGLVRPKRRSIKRASKRSVGYDMNAMGQIGQIEELEEIDDQPDWQTQSTAQIGYGEITKGAMQKFLQILQNIDQAFGPEHEPYLKFKKKDYNLTENDIFIDIGSGFGKPVFHAAIQVGCHSKGVEIVPARVEFCIDFVYEYENKHKALIEKEEKRIQELEAEKSKGSLTPTQPKRQSKTNNAYTCNPLAVDAQSYEEKGNGKSTKSPSQKSK